MTRDELARHLYIHAHDADNPPPGWVTPAGRAVVVCDDPPEPPAREPLEQVAAKLTAIVAGEYPEMSAEDQHYYSAAALAKIVNLFEFHPGCDIVITAVDADGNVVSWRATVIRDEGPVA
jgi:xanthine dehydrogenase iron-sulfur cluster and FAD-binding subunit A